MIKEYFERIAMEHSMLRHSDAEPHFASSMDDAATLMARRLFYPAMFLDGGNFEVSGSDNSYLLNEDYTLAIVDHVKDSGNVKEVEQAFAQTRVILRDIVARMIRDKRKALKPMVRFNASGIQGVRVELVEAGLYGWLLFLNIPEPLPTLNCNENLDS